MRTKLKANVIISNDADGKNVLFGFDDTLAEEIIDVYTRCVSGKFSVAAGGAVFEDIPFGDITAVKGIFIKSGAGFNYIMNGGGDTFTANAATTTGSSRVFLQTNLSNFRVINTSATDILTGIWVAWGDPTS
jgi:hypothetical protein|tara:strand:- start:11328 stop:11723 length:396 start_codon:yes stop_codon:yes gene_type:complete